MKKTVNVGDRVKMTGLMPNDPCPVEVGTEGTVTMAANSFGQIYVDWDDSRTLILLDTDPFIVIPNNQPEGK